MKVSCKICWISCVSCSWKCKCGMKDYQVRISNKILDIYPEWLWEKDKLDKLISLVINWNPEHLIIEYILNNKEIPKPTSEWKYVSWYCEYPIGSVSQWAWAKCINCWTERFYQKWLCKWKETLISKEE
jgi:hypothetical protein